MLKKLALAVLAAVAIGVGIFELDSWISIQQIYDQGLYKVTSIEKIDGSLREIRIDAQTPGRRDIAWYAGDLMESFSFTGEVQKVQLGSVLLCSKREQISIITRRAVPGTARYSCSSDIQGPGNRRVLAFVAIPRSSATVNMVNLGTGEYQCACSHSPSSACSASLTAPPPNTSRKIAAE